MSDCHFWQDICAAEHESVFSPTFIKFRENRAGRVIRLIELFSCLIPLVATKKSFEKEYGLVNKRVFDSISKKLQPNSLPLQFIDSSKDIYRFCYMARSGYFELNVVRLIKLPEAFVYSNIKTMTGNTRFKWLLRSSFRWVIENMIAEILVMVNVKHRVIKVTYEQLCDQTEKVLTHLEQAFGLQVYHDGEERLQSHAIAGNEMRSHFHGDIVLDEQWKNKLSVTEKAIVMAICWPSKFFLYRPLRLD